MSTLWWFDPFFEAQVARGRPGLSPKRAIVELGLDLEHFPVFLAQPRDIVAVREPPSSPWLHQMSQAGFTLPELFQLEGRAPWRPLAPRPIGDIQPWGWAPHVHGSLQALRSQLPPQASARAALETPYPELPSPGVAPKDWAADFLRRWLTDHPEFDSLLVPADEVGRPLRNFEEVEAWTENALRGGDIPVFKTPLATAGRGIKRVVNREELQGPLGAWVRSTLDAQGRVLAEPFRDKVCDLSAQLHVPRSGAHPEVLGIRSFYTHGPFAYAGTFLHGQGETTVAPGGVHPHLDPGALTAWQSMLRALGTELSQRGYTGPAGVDAMVYRTRQQAVRLHPLVELNPRWTLGRVALAIERRLAKNTDASWTLLPRSAWPDGRLDWMTQALRQHPVTMDASGRLTRGLLPTSDPTKTRQISSLLAVGDSRSVMKEFGFHDPA